MQTKTQKQYEAMFEADGKTGSYMFYVNLKVA